MARSRRRVAAPLLAILAATACWTDRADLVVANGADPALLDPQMATGAPEMRILWALHSGLTRLDPSTLRPGPALAESWEALEGGQEWQFHLRAQLRWSDGSALDGRDVLESWLRLLDPATAAPYRDWLLPLEGAPDWRPGAPPPAGLRLDGRTLTVRFVHPVPWFAEMCAFPALAPLPPAARARAASEPHDSAVGCGPFRLVARRVRDRVRLERNPFFWNAAEVRLRHLDFLTVESRVTALNLFLAGQADYVVDVPPLVVPALEEREARRGPGAPGGREFEPHPLFGTEFLRLNCRRGPLRDPRVRRALSLAVDRDGIAAALGAAAPARSFVPPLIPGYAPAEGCRLDLAEARRLLAEAGHAGGAGLPSFRFVYTAGELQRDVAEALQDQWRRHLGIEVLLDLQEWKSARSAMDRGDYDIARSSWIGDYLDASTFLEVFQSGGGNNRTGWSDAGYDALLRAARHSTDPVQRAAALREAEASLLEQAPIVPLYHYLGLDLVSGRLVGLERNALLYVDWSRVQPRAPSGGT